MQQSTLGNPGLRAHAPAHARTGARTGARTHRRTHARAHVRGSESRRDCSQRRRSVCCGPLANTVSILHYRCDSPIGCAAHRMGESARTSAKFSRLSVRVRRCSRLPWSRSTSKSHAPFALRSTAPQAMAARAAPRGGRRLRGRRRAAHADRAPGALVDGSGIPLRPVSEDLRPPRRGSDR